MLLKHDQDNTLKEMKIAVCLYLRESWGLEKFSEEVKINTWPTPGQGIKNKRLSYRTLVSPEENIDTTTSPSGPGIIMEEGPERMKKLEAMNGYKQRLTSGHTRAASDMNS